MASHYTVITQFFSDDRDSQWSDHADFHDALEAMQATHRVLRGLGIPHTVTTMVDGAPHTVRRMTPDD